MTRVVVYTLLATIFILFILYSQNDQENTNKHGSLGRRLGYKLPTFDPLVIKMERLEEDGKHDELNSRYNNSLGDEVGDPNHYFGDEGRLNITLRLMVLFPMLDKAPKDGVIDFKELETWNAQMALDRLRYRTEREMVSHDKDGNGAIDFKECLPQLTDAEIEKNGMAHGEAGWWKEQFVNADFDKNGYLSFNEFKDFLHPEDSKDEQIQRWLLREKIKRMDYDSDGKLNLEEFRVGAYDIYKNYVELENSGADSPTPENKFSELDVNNDKVLTVEELRPILCYLYPGELSYAKYFASYLFHKVDDNRDGVLTLSEMLNHEYIFYSTIYDASYEYEDDDDFHNEL